MKKICCFAGHSRLVDVSRNKLITEAEKLITENGVTEFMVGNYGEFDRLAASAIRELKQKYPDIELNLTIPYLIKNMNTGYFDNIIIADIPESTPKSIRIIKCNEYMVNNHRSVIRTCF